MPTVSADWVYEINDDGTIDHYLLGPKGGRSDVPVLETSNGNTVLVGADGSPLLGWTKIYEIEVTAGNEPTSLNITGLDRGYDLIRVEGLVMPSLTSVFYPQFTLNGITAAEYVYLYQATTSSGATYTNYPSGAPNTNCQFGPALSLGEMCFISMQLTGKSVGVAAAKGFMINADLRPMANDWHKVGGQLRTGAVETPLSSIQIFSGAPFGASKMEVGTRLKVYGFS